MNKLYEKLKKEQINLLYELAYEEDLMKKAILQQKIREKVDEMLYIIQSNERERD